MQCAVIVVPSFLEISRSLWACSGELWFGFIFAFITTDLPSLQADEKTVLTWLLVTQESKSLIMDATETKMAVPFNVLRVTRLYLGKKRIVSLCVMDVTPIVG